jgi:hypothetical protein
VKDHPPAIHRGFDSSESGTCLAITQTSVVVFRATVLSIVLLFAAGPSVPLFCKAWCDPREAAARGCHHEDNGGSPRVTSDISCQDSIQATAILLKKDLRRAATEDACDVISVAHVLFAPAATSLRAIGNQGRAPSDLTRPLTTPLRI